MDHSCHYAQPFGSSLDGSSHPSSSRQPDREDVKPSITPIPAVRAASAPHPSSSINPRKRVREDREPPEPDREQKQTKHRLRAAERRTKQSQTLAELSALLPDALLKSLYADVKPFITPTTPPFRAANAPPPSSSTNPRVHSPGSESELGLDREQE